MALGAPSFQAFNQELFACLAHVIGFDTAAASWTQGANSPPDLASLGYPQSQIQSDFVRYMNGLMPHELARFTGPDMAVDLDVISVGRRSSLAVYRELLAPHGVSSFVTNLWHSRSGVLGIHFGREGHVTPFEQRAQDAFARLLPVVRIGMALVGAEEATTRSLVQTESWAADWCLSERERDTVRLVARGFRNGEVAQMLRVSPNTVRNHLASVFRKAEVSTRAELLFAMNASQSSGTRHVKPRDAPERSWRAFLEAGEQTGGS
jgi:DNA-binding CsgD family transcriptional regulator